MRNYQKVLLAFVVATTISIELTHAQYDVYIGDTTGAPFWVHPGEAARVPIWIKTDPMNLQDSVTFALISAASETTYIEVRLGGTCNPLYWFSCNFSVPEPLPGVPNYISQNFEGYSNYGLNSQGTYCRVAEFHMLIASDSAIINDTANCMQLGSQPPMFGMQDGLTSVIPIMHFGPLFITNAIRGDVNNSGVMNPQDVVYLVRYLKGYLPPPTYPVAADINGDGEINGIDVEIMVSYFKGLIDLP